MKKMLTLLLCVCLVVGMFAGCGKGRTDYPETIDAQFSEIAKITRGDYDTTFTVKADGTDLTIQTVCSVNGTDYKLSKLAVHGKIQGITPRATELDFEIKDLLIVVKDVMYLDLDALKGVVADNAKDLLGAEFCKAVAETEFGYLAIPLPDEYTGTMADIKQMQQELILSLIPQVTKTGEVTSKEHEFVLTLEDGNALAKLMDVFADFVEKNSNTFKDMEDKAFAVKGNEYMKKLADFYAEDLKKAFAEEVPEEQIDAMLDELAGEDLDGILDDLADTVGYPDYRETADEMRETAKDYRATAGEGELSLVLGAKANGYRYTVDMKHVDEYKGNRKEFTVHSEIFSHLVTINAPTKIFNDYMVLFDLAEKIDLNLGDVWTEGWDYDTETETGWDIEVETEEYTDDSSWD